MTSPVSPQQAAAELLARREARRSLLAFTTYTKPDYAPAEHHRRITAALEAVERGVIKRLMVSLPPRGGKSELVSRRFPAWVLGRNPGFELISASYNADLASDFGRDVRSIVRDDPFGKLFPDCRLRADSAAVDRWHTTTNGAYRAVGVGGAMTGRGADGLIIDDPLKDRQAADSETTREHVWDWYRSTAYTRLSKEGWVIVCQTRWHDEDISGKLIEAEAKGGETWHKIIIPAIDNGVSFWPERFPLERLNAIQNVSGPREWAALYMQQPQPDEGTFFQRDWFRRFTHRPAALAIYGTSDYATREGEGDYTVHRVWGVDPSGDIHMLDGWRGQTTSDVWIERMVDLVAAWKPFAWFGEAGPIFRAVEPALRRRMAERKVFCRIETLASIADKPTRARGFQARAAMGRVWLPDTPEGEAVLDEYLRFPAGKHDDEVDAASIIGRALDQAHPAIVPVTPVGENTPQDRYMRRRQPETAGGMYG